MGDPFGNTKLGFSICVILSVPNVLHSYISCNIVYDINDDMLWIVLTENFLLCNDYLALNDTECQTNLGQLLFRISTKTIVTVSANQNS